MYIQRSVLLLFLILLLVFLIGTDWIRGPGAAWYRPFLIGLGIIGLSAWLRRYHESDGY